MTQSLYNKSLFHCTTSIRWDHAIKSGPPDVQFLRVFRRTFHVIINCARWSCEPTRLKVEAEVSTPRHPGYREPPTDHFVCLNIFVSYKFLPSSTTAWWSMTWNTSSAEAEVLRDKNVTLVITFTAAYPKKFLKTARNESQSPVSGVSVSLLLNLCRFFCKINFQN